MASWRPEVPDNLINKVCELIAGLFQIFHANQVTMFPISFACVNVVHRFLIREWFSAAADDFDPLVIIQGT